MFRAARLRHTPFLFVGSLHTRGSNAGPTWWRSARGRQGVTKGSAIPACAVSNCEIAHTAARAVVRSEAGNPRSGAVATRRRLRADPEPLPQKEAGASASQAKPVVEHDAQALSARPRRGGGLRRRAVIPARQHRGRRRHVRDVAGQSHAGRNAEATRRLGGPPTGRSRPRLWPRST